MTRTEAEAQEELGQLGHPGFGFRVGFLSPPRPPSRLSVSPRPESCLYTSLGLALTPLQPQGRTFHLLSLRGRTAEVSEGLSTLASSTSLTPSLGTPSAFTEGPGGQTPAVLRAVDKVALSTAAGAVLRGGSGWACALSQEVGLRDWHKANGGRWTHTLVPS